MGLFKHPLYVSISIVLAKFSVHPERSVSLFYSFSLSQVLPCCCTLSTALRQYYYSLLTKILNILYCLHLLPSFPDLDFYCFADIAFPPFPSQLLTS